MEASPQPAQRPAALIVNTRSRGGREGYEEALRLMRERGMEIVAELPLDHPSNLQRALDRAFERGAGLIVLGSGDGTTGPFAARLAHTDAVLGLLPLGTTNNVARTLGMPLELPAAVDVLFSGVVRPIDLGRVDEHRFINIATIGFNAIIAAHVPVWLKRVSGRGAYALTGAAALLTPRRFSATVHIDGTDEVMDALQLVVANGRFHGGVPLREQSGLEEGRIRVFRLGGSSGLSFLLSLAALSLRLYQPGDTALLVEDAIISADPPQHVEVDGEPVGYTPVRVGVEREALRVMVPRDFADCEREAAA